MKNMPNFRGRDSLRRHNLEGHRIAEKSFRDQYGRNPEKNQRRDYHKRVTQGHAVSIDSCDFSVPVFSIRDILASPPNRTARWYPQKPQTNREKSNQIYDMLSLDPNIVFLERKRGLVGDILYTTFITRRMDESVGVVTETSTPMVGLSFN